MSQGWTEARHRKEAKEDVSEQALAPAHHHGGPLQHLPMAAHWPGRQGADPPVNLSPGEEWHSTCTRLSPCQQQHMHGMVLPGLVGSCPLWGEEVCRHRATPCLCSYPFVAPAGFSSLCSLARTPPCLAVGEKCAHCTPHPLQCPTAGKEDKLARHLTGSSLKGFLAVADIAHCSQYMFHVKGISDADHVPRLPDPAKDTKGPQ